MHTSYPELCGAILQFVIVLVIVFVLVVKTTTRGQGRLQSIGERPEAEAERMRAWMRASSPGTVPAQSAPVEPALEVVQNAIVAIDRLMAGSDEEDLLEFAVPGAADEIRSAAYAATVMASTGEYGGWVGRATAQIYEVAVVGSRDRGTMQVRVLYVGPTPHRTMESAMVYRDQVWLVGRVLREGCEECGAPLNPKRHQCAYCGAPTRSGEMMIVSVAPSNQTSSSVRKGVASFEGTSIEAHSAGRAYGDSPGSPSPGN